MAVLDLRPGGGANIGAELAARAAPDGHTLFELTQTHSVNATLSNCASLSSSRPMRFSPGAIASRSTRP